MIHLNEFKLLVVEVEYQTLQMLRICIYIFSNLHLPSNCFPLHVGKYNIYLDKYTYVCNVYIHMYLDPN